MNVEPVPKWVATTTVDLELLDSNCLPNRDLYNELMTINGQMANLNLP